MFGVLEASVQRANCIELTFQNVRSLAILLIHGLYTLAARDNALS